MRIPRIPQVVDGYSLEPMSQADILNCHALLLQGNDFLIEGLGPSEINFRNFVENIGMQLWAWQCTYKYQGIFGGFILTTSVDVQSLNARIVGVFSEPRQARIPLLMYMYRLFWSYPLQKIYAQMPEIAEPYLDLYKAAGFQKEGVYRQHQVIAGQRCDVVVMGSLREEYEAWCKKYEPRFSLDLQLRR
jgi:hypothetical protein